MKHWLYERAIGLHRPHSPMPRALDLRHPTGQSVIILGGVAIVISGAVLALWASGVWPESRPDPDVGMGVSVALLIGIPGALLIALGIYNRLAESVFSRVSMHIEPQPARLGEEFTVMVHVEPGFTRRIDSAVATLTSSQFVHDETGRGSYIADRLDRYLSHRTLAPAMDLREGGLLEWSATFRIPRGKPASLASRSKTVRWTVQVRVKVPWWPDWRRTRDIEVLPARREG